MTEIHSDIVRTDVVNENNESVHVRERAAWSPAQIVAVVAGLVLVVVGGIGLSKAGLHFHDIPLTRVQAAGMGFTSLSALVQLVAGVLILGGGAYPDTAKSTMGVFGVGLLAFGLVVAISTTPFYTEWGFVRANGVFYAIVGAILLVAAAVSPIFASRSRVVARQREVYVDGASRVVH
jgi:hypothetical protein